jgi:hypothetical protein
MCFTPIATSNRKTGVLGRTIALPTPLRTGDRPSWDTEQEKSYRRPDVHRTTYILFVNVRREALFRFYGPQKPLFDKT